MSLHRARAFAGCDAIRADPYTLPHPCSSEGEDARLAGQDIPHMDGAELAGELDRVIRALTHCPAGAILVIAPGQPPVAVRDWLRHRLRVIEAEIEHRQEESAPKSPARPVAPRADPIMETRRRLRCSETQARAVLAAQVHG